MTAIYIGVLGRTVRKCYGESHHVTPSRCRDRPVSVARGRPSCSICIARRGHRPARQQPVRRDGDGPRKDHLQGRRAQAGGARRHRHRPPIGVTGAEPHRSQEVEDPIALAVLAAPHAIARVTFERNISLKQFLDAVEDGMQKTADAGWLSEEEFLDINGWMPRWFGFWLRMGSGTGM